MLNRKRAQAYCGAALAVCLPAIVWFRHSLLSTLILVCLVAVLVILFVRADRIIHSGKWKESLDESRSELIRTLNRHRHDWMNDVQVLFGYAKLQKYDKMLEHVEKIKEKMARESSMSKLGVPSFIYFLLTFRNKNDAFILDFRNDRGLNLSALPVDGEQITELVRNIVSVFQTHALPSFGEPNRLVLSLHAEENGLMIRFDYSGPYRDELENAVAQALSEPARPIAGNYDFAKEQAAVNVRVPFAV